MYDLALEKRPGKGPSRFLLTEEGESIMTDPLSPVKSSPIIICDPIVVERIPKHGTVTDYRKYHCRCQLCKNAHARNTAAYRARRKAREQAASR